MVSGNFGCVGNIPISSSQEDVFLALDHGVGVRMHDALTLHGALGPKFMLGTTQRLGEALL